MTFTTLSPMFKLDTWIMTACDGKETTIGICLIVCTAYRVVFIGTCIPTVFLRITG